MKQKLLIVFIIFLMCGLHAGHLSAQENVIRLNVSPEGYPPYFVVEDEKVSGGILFDVVQEIAAKYGYTVEPQYIPRKRVDLQMEQGVLDATARAKEWVSNADDYEFTDPIIKARDVLFMLQDSSLDFQTVEDLLGKRIATHLGYKYPLLEDYFKDNRIEREDSTTERSMLQKVLRKRTEVALVNESVGLWLIKQNQWEGKLRLSEKDLGSFDYRIMFLKKWKPFVEQFNKELALMKEDGRLEEIINRYR